MYRLVPPCTVQVQGSTYWYVLVCTVIGITYVCTYWYVLVWTVIGITYVGTYWYVPF